MDRTTKAPSQCSIDGCTRPVTCRGWCAAHYARWYRKGDPGAAQFVRHYPRIGDCDVAGCEYALYARGLCKMHYMRQRDGVPLDAPLRLSRDGECSLPECDRPIVAQGVCANHYRSLRLYGDFHHVLVPIETCSVEGCGKPHEARGWCNEHYLRWKRTGDPIKPLVHKNNKGGYLTKEGYKMVHVRGRKILEHRLVMEQMLGRPLTGDENVHHRNGHRADNRPENLELWVSAQPPRQNVEDLVAWAHQILSDYEGDVKQLQLFHDPPKRKRKTTKT